MKNFRNPYVASFLASIILFVSCTTPSVGTEEEIVLVNKVSDQTKRNLSSLIYDNLLLVNQIKNLLTRENDVDYAFLENNKEYINLDSEAREILITAGIINHQDFISVFEQIKNNFEIFIDRNPEFIEQPMNVKNELILNEIALQYGLDENLINYSPEDDCWDDRVNAENKCARNWAIGMGISFLGGLASFGWGAAIGFTAAQLQVALCLQEAVDEFLECKENNNNDQ